MGARPKVSTAEKAAFVPFATMDEALQRTADYYRTVTRQTHLDARLQNYINHTSQPPTLAWINDKVSKGNWWWWA